jgi:hypothetical protein
LSRLKQLCIHTYIQCIRSKEFFYLGTICRFSWNGTTVYLKSSMITAVWTHLRMFLISKFYHFRVKCWILLKPVLGGVEGNLHFPVPSMNRLNQTEPATFLILLCWTFFRDSVFLYFRWQLRLMLECEIIKENLLNPTSPTTINILHYMCLNTSYILNEKKLLYCHQRLG